MGNTASKSSKAAGRTLKRVSPDTRAAAQQGSEKLAPPVASTRTPLPADAPNSTEKSEPFQDDFRKRLQDIGPVKFKKHGIEPRPASEDEFTTTLNSRSKLQAADDAEVEAAKARPMAKKLLPSQTVHAVVKALQDGAPVDDVVRTYSLDPTILDNLSALRVPKHVEPAQGRRRRR